jgi:hypothetical protein
MNKDVKYMNIPNICFSLTDKDDKREIEYKKQRIERGFDDSETWSLTDTICGFLIPRLKRFKECANVIPESTTREEWNVILDKMIFAFTHIISTDSSPKNRFEKKLAKEYIETYGDVWEKKDSNLKDHSYHLFVNESENLKDSDTASMMCPEENFTDTTIAEEKAKGLTYKGFKERPFHHNDELDKEMNDMCDEGLELFGKYFNTL